MKKNDFNKLKIELCSKYNLDEFSYKDIHTKSTAICDSHGRFLTSVARLRKGQRCPRCAFENKVFNNEQFIEKCKKIWNNRYSYEKTKWFNSKCEVVITCLEHGDFTQFASNHLKGYGCAECRKRDSFETFKERANDVHNFKWDYSKAQYTNNKTKIEIICKKHGTFFQRPDNHLQGNSCPKCSISRGELKIIQILEKNRIKYETQKSFENCKFKYKLRFDIWLPDHNTCIEYDGEQQTNPVIFFGGIEKLQKRKQYDNIKNIFCINNNINLIRISYRQEANIEEYILENLKN